MTCGNRNDTLKYLGDSTEILKGIFEKQEQFSKRIVFAKRVGKSIITQKGLENRSSCFEPKNSWLSFSRGSGPPLRFRSTLKGGPEPLEKEIHEILGPKREDRFSDPFFELVQKTCQVPASAW